MRLELYLIIQRQRHQAVSSAACGPGQLAIIDGAMNSELYK